MVNVNDYAARPARVLADEEVLTNGRYRRRFRHTPHVPHNREAGFLFDGVRQAGRFFDQPIKADLYERMSCGWRDDLSSTGHFVLLETMWTSGKGKSSRYPDLLSACALRVIRERRQST